MEMIDRDVVKKLAALSRIKCTDEEESSLLIDLQHTLERFEELEQIDTENVPTCYTVLEGLVNVMREDAIGDTLEREQFLKNCPSIGGMVRVPPVLKTTAT